MTVGQTWFVWLMLAPLYSALFIALGTIWWPFTPTLEIIYAAPFFCSQPCQTREEAERYKVTAVPSGTPHVWHYREFKLTAQRIGTIRASWHDGAVIWPAPQMPTLGAPPGTYRISLAVTPPVTAIPRLYEYRTAFHYRLHGWRDELIEYPPVYLNVAPYDDSHERRPEGTRTTGEKPNASR